MTDDLRDNIIDALKAQDLLAIPSDDALLLTVRIDDIDITLKCTFDSAFPYTFPRIYITPESKDKLDAIPHINTDNSICVFDAGIAIPNFNEPVQLTTDTIMKAIDVISKGVRKENHWDFLDEFNAYWDTKAVWKANSFVSELEKYSTINFCFQST